MSFGGGWRGGGGGGGQSGGYRGGSSSSFRQSTGSRAPCKFWAAGTCNRGASCNFSHDAPRGGATRTLNNNNQQSAANNPFGAPQQQSSPWGDSSAATGAGVWGTGGATQPSNPFQTQQNSFSGMGSSGDNGAASSSPFSSFNQPAANPFSSFASQPPVQQQPFGTSAFGTSSFATPNTGFNTSNNNNTSAFGTSSFGTAANNSAAQSNPFAAFSQPSSGGGAAASPFASAFGTTSTSLTDSSPFASSSSAASPFASAPTSTAFGQPQSQQSSLFQPQPLSTSNPFQSLQPTNNPFQALQQPTASTDPFGTASTPAARQPQLTKLECGHTGLAQCAEQFKQDCVPYPFTSYTHDKCPGPCLVGDVSFEEWRWEVVEAEAQGRLAEVARKYEERRAEMNKARELLYSKPELLHRDVSGWTYEQQVEAVRRGGELDTAAGSANLMGGMDAGMGRDVSSVMAASSPTASTASPFSTFPTSAATGAPSSSVFGTVAAAPTAAPSFASMPGISLPTSPGPPGGATLQSTAPQLVPSAVSTASAAGSQVSAGVVMSEAEVEQAWRAPAFAWGRVPELPPPAVSG